MSFSQQHYSLAEALALLMVENDNDSERDASEDRENELIPGDTIGDGVYKE